MKITPLTSVEEQLMRLLWQMNSFYLKDIMALHPEPKPHQNTISTYLKILLEKGYLKAEKEGRIFKYNIAIPEKNYREFLLLELREKFFLAETLDMIAILREKNYLSSEDLAGILDIKKQTKEVKQADSFILTQELIKDKKKKKDKKKDKKKNKE